MRYRRDKLDNAGLVRCVFNVLNILESQKVSNLVMNYSNLRKLVENVAKTDYLISSLPSRETFIKLRHP